MASVRDVQDENRLYEYPKKGTGMLNSSPGHHTIFLHDVPVLSNIPAKKNSWYLTP